MACCYNQEKLTVANSGDRFRSHCYAPEAGSRRRRAPASHPLASTPGKPNGLEEFWPQFAAVTTRIKYDGTEGELYDLKNDPLQWENLWDDPGKQRLKRDLIADLYDNLPPEREQKLKVEAPA